MAGARFSFSQEEVNLYEVCSADIYTARLPEYSSKSDDTMFKWKSPGLDL